MTAQTSADLLAAAEWLTVNGWTQGAYRDDLGGDVLAALLAGADHDRPRFSAACAAFRKHTSIGHLAVWNDKPGRTAEDVITRLASAAVTDAA